MRVIDSHFHVWRQADLPWLSGPMQPRIFGPYEAIRRENQDAASVRGELPRLGAPLSGAEAVRRLAQRGSEDGQNRREIA